MRGNNGSCRKVFKGGREILERGEKISQGRMPGVTGLGPEGKVGEGQMRDKFPVWCQLLCYPDLFSMPTVQGEKGQADEEECDAAEEKACPYHW